MNEGGFDVIIGNPPFVEFTPSKVDYQLHNYKTDSCGNLYAFVAERCASLLKKQGSFSFIMPSASCCTPRMQPLMTLLEERYKFLWVSIYDERPSKLFDGVDQQLSIHITRLQGNAQDVFITPMRHWSTTPENERPVLFATIRYQKLKPEFRVAKVLSKVGDDSELHLLEKILSTQSTNIAYLQLSQPQKKIFYRNAGGRYWRLVKSFPTKFKSEGGRKQTTTEKELEVGALYIPLLVSLYSSSLFYWFWRVVSNCRHLTDREFEAFPIPKSLIEARFLNKIEDLWKAYEKRLVETKIEKRTENTRSGTIVQDEYKIITAKPIIDEIDRALARHYGLSAEELDFIINYDVKYRMGASAGEEGEE